MANQSDIDKAAVAARFSKAAAGYDAIAQLQRDIGETLQRQIPASDRGTVLDLGSGTGYFTERLADTYQQVIGLDLAWGMLEYSSKRRGQNNISWLNGDAEQLPLADNSLDLVYSSLALQWCQPALKSFAEIRRVLKPGGHLVFSSLLQGTLEELGQSWLEVDGLSHINEFSPLEQVRQSLLDAGFTHIQISQETKVLAYPSVIALMRDLKGIGASHLHHQQGATKGLEGRSKIKALSGAYEAKRTPAGILPATYQVCYGIIRND